MVWRDPAGPDPSKHGNIILAPTHSIQKLLATARRLNETRASAGIESDPAPQLESNWTPRLSWNRTGRRASAGTEPDAVPQLESNRTRCLSWNRTGRRASAGTEPDAVPQLEPNRTPCLSWNRTGASAGIEPVPQLESNRPPAGCPLLCSALR
jgi:hypothetical protein